MKKIFFYLFLVSLMSYFSYHLTIYYIPKTVYGVLHYKMEKNQNLQDNEIKHLDVPNHKSRDVVMPNPDFLYSVCFYDLSEGDLNLTGTMPDSTYWSVSFYKPNTINWYVKNDKEFNTNQLDIKLSLLNRKEENTLKSPEKNGLMIIRILVEKKDQKSLDYFKSLQKSIVIK
jgi:uncharacterized membrane protein